MPTEPLYQTVGRRLQTAAKSLGASNPLALPQIAGVLQRTFPLPLGESYGRNALTPRAAPFEASYSAMQPGMLRYTIEPGPPGSAGIDRRDEATREMRRLVGDCIGREALRWFDERSEPWRAWTVGGRLNYGAFFGTSHDADGLYATKVYYEMQPGQTDQLPSNIAGLAQLALELLPSLVPLFTTISAQREMGGQRLTFAHTAPLRLADLGPLLEAMGMGQRLPGIMQTIGLVLGGRFDLPPHGCLIAIGPGADGPEFEIYVLLSALNDLPANFLSLLTLGLAERPRELMALERWMEAFTPEDDVWPGRFSILSLRCSRSSPPRVSLDLRPAEFELPVQALNGNGAAAAYA